MPFSSISQSHTDQTRISRESANQINHIIAATNKSHFAPPKTKSSVHHQTVAVSSENSLHGLQPFVYQEVGAVNKEALYCATTPRWSPSLASNRLKLPPSQTQTSLQHASRKRWSWETIKTPPAKFLIARIKASMVSAKNERKSSFNA